MSANPTPEARHPWTPVAVQPPERRHVHLWSAEHGANFCGLFTAVEPSTLFPARANCEGCLRSALNDGVILPMPSEIARLGMEELRQRLAGHWGPTP